MRQKFCAALAVIITCSGPAAAMDASGNFEIRGAGTNSCGAWTTSHNDKSVAMVAVLDNWVMGYVTSYNLWGFKGGSDIAENIDADGLVAAVTQYCAAHPLDSVSTASEDLISQLLNKWMSNHPAPTPKKQP